jgi:hypothetical protein
MLKTAASRATRVLMTAVVLALGCAPALVGGCNIVAPIAAVAAGPPKVEAVYTLADVPTVVFVDDRTNLVSPVSLRRTIADTVSSELMSNKLVTMTISPNDAMLIAGRSDRASNIMSVEDIGKAVGAQQVILVKMVQFQDSPDNSTPRPVASVDVKVIDVTNRQRVFPTGASGAGYPVTVTGKPVDPSQFASRSSRLQIYQTLSVELGNEIAKMFYKHDYKELGERISQPH